MVMQQTEMVALGELKVSNAREQVFTVANIGTGVVVTIFDPVCKAGGLAHVVLPENNIATASVSPGASPLSAKFADEAIPQLLDAFEKEGGDAQRSVVRIVGGAQLFNFGGGTSNILNVGTRNVTAVQAALTKAGLAVENSDVGGNKARSLRFTLATGEIVVSQIGGEEYLV